MTEQNISPRPTPWLRLAQAAWLILMISVVGLYVIGLSVELQRPVLLCEGIGSPCTEPEAARALAHYGLSPDLARWLITGLLSIVVPVASLLMAGFIFWRRPDRLITLAVAGMLALNGPAVNTDMLGVGLAALGLHEAEPVFEFSFLVFVLFVIYAFPSGTFMPRWAGWLMGLGLAGHLVIVFATGQAVSDVNAITLATLLLGLVLQVYRYRRSATQVERQQSKWVVVGLAAFLLNAVLFFGVALPATETVEGMPILYLYMPVNAVLVLSLPAALMFASLRYRLWEIDVIIRRTLVYALLTGLLTLAYLGLVVTLQGLAGGLTGQRNSALVTVLSTLAIAALFAPLRRRVQAFVDRRFYRRKYDATQTLAAFAAQSRDEVDIDRLRDELRAVVDETMQPEQVGVWLRE